MAALDSGNATGDDPVTFVYPHDPRDGWEPGAPSLRNMAPSMIGGALIPLGVYYLVRSHVGSDTTALALAGVPAAAWVEIEWLRRRTIDPIGTATLFGFIAGLIVSYSLGGDAFVLKVRDSAVTGLAGLICLASLRIGQRPVMFYVGRTLSAGDDPSRQGVYDALWAISPARAVFRILTMVWAMSLLCESAFRVLLATVLPTGPFLAASAGLSTVFLGGAGAFSIWMSSWVRTRAEALGHLDLGPSDESTREWLRQFMRSDRAIRSK